MLALRLPEEIEERLATLAKETGRTKSYYARKAILTYLEDLEDTYIAEKAYTEWVKGGKKTISYDEMKKRLGLAD